MSKRVNYDSVAPVYDRPWYRQKSFDPMLHEYLLKPGFDGRIHVLDVGCGTGAQLEANKRERPDLLYIGIDPSREMVRIAQAREPDIHWLRGNASTMPFPDEVFDYVSNQFALHHISHKHDFFVETARVLRMGGRVVIRNLDPWSMTNWTLYRYFPAALERAMTDFMSVQEITASLVLVGLVNVKVERRFRADPVLLGEFAHDVSNRQGRSELIALTDSDYEQGIKRVEADLERLGANTVLDSEKCDVTILGDKL